MHFAFMHLQVSSRDADAFCCDRKDPSTLDVADFSARHKIFEDDGCQSVVFHLNLSVNVRTLTLFFPGKILYCWGESMFCVRPVLQCA